MLTEKSVQLVQQPRIDDRVEPVHESRAAGHRKSNTRREPESVTDRQTLEEGSDSTANTSGLIEPVRRIESCSYACEAWES